MYFVPYDVSTYYTLCKAILLIKPTWSLTFHEIQATIKQMSSAETKQFKDVSAVRFLYAHTDKHIAYCAVSVCYKCVLTIVTHPIPLLTLANTNMSSFVACPLSCILLVFIPIVIMNDAYWSLVFSRAFVNQNKHSDFRVLVRDIYFSHKSECICTKMFNVYYIYQSRTRFMLTYSRLNPVKQYLCIRMATFIVKFKFY